MTSKGPENFPRPVPTLPPPANSATPKEQELPQHKLDNSTPVRSEIPGTSKAVSFLPKCAGVEISVPSRAEL